MILRITFNDNDYTELLRLFIQNGRLSYSGLREFVRMRHPKELIDYDKCYNQRNFMIIENTRKQDFIHYVKEAIIDYIMRQGYDLDTIKYLENELEVTITNQYRNKWENGEVIYFMLHNGNQYIIN